MTAFKRAVFLIFVSGIVSPLTFASQSTVLYRSLYTSDQTFGNQITGLYGLEDQSTVHFGAAFARTPMPPSIGKPDTYYAGNVGLSYGLSKLAVDFGANYSQSPLAKLQTFGGSIGFTYLYYKDPEDEVGGYKRSLSLLHSQSYPEDGEQAPFMWIRLGYSGAVLRSTAGGAGIRSGAEYAVTADMTVPATSNFFLLFGSGLYGYDDRKNLFSSAAEVQTTINGAMLGSTIQGLPMQSYTWGMIWQLTRWDAFTPRYQGTILLGSEKWVHTGQFIWKHQFSGRLAVSPTLEFSNVAARTSSGAGLEFTYVL